MAVLYTQHFVQFFDDNGNPLSGGRLYTYDAGGTTPKATYSDAAGSVLNANPVVLDAAGRATVFLDGTTYRFDLKTAGDVLVRSTDNIQSFGVVQSNINNASLAIMPANSVKANTSATSNTPSDLSINTNSFLGRADGNITNIPLNYGRNKIINGDLRIWQRGTSGTPALNTTAYTADRVFTYATGASPTVSRLLLGSTGNPTTCAYALYAVGTAGNTAFQIGQKIESLNCLDMIAGRVYTFSAWMFCTTAVTPTWQVYNANVTDNWSANTLVSSGTFASVSANTWTRVTGSFTSTNGCLNGVQLIFDVGTLVSGKNIYITGIQLEQGSVATPFEHRLIAPELVLCQRNYETGFAIMETYGLLNGVLSMTPYFKAAKRTNPTVTVADNGSVWMTGAFSVPSVSADSFRLTRSKDGTSGHFIMSASWIAEAEL